MAQAGGTLQNYNSELVGCIEELREKREELNKSIAADEEEKAKIQNDLRILTERLARINDNLARKVSSRNEYDKTIQEARRHRRERRATLTQLSLLLARRCCLPPLPPLSLTHPRWRDARRRRRRTRRSWSRRRRCCTSSSARASTSPSRSRPLRRERVRPRERHERVPPRLCLCGSRRQRSV